MLCQLNNTAHKITIQCRVYHSQNFILPNHSSHHYNLCNRRRQLQLMQMTTYLNNERFYHQIAVQTSKTFISQPFSSLLVYNSSVWSDLLTLLAYCVHAVVKVLEQAFATIVFTGDASTVVQM